MSTFRREPVIAGIAMLALAACSGDHPVPAAPPSGGGPGVVDPPSATLPENITDSLRRLGVSTAGSPRISNDGLPLPADFSPFGQRLKIAIDADGHVSIGAPMEFVIGGFSLAGSSDPFVVIDNFGAGTFPAGIATSPVYTLSGLQAPWASPANARKFDGDPPTTLHDAAGGDLDNDGYDDLVVAFVESGQVMVRIANLAGGATPAEVFAMPVPADVLPVGDVRVSVADLDGDGMAEIVASISQAASPGGATRTVLLVLDRTATGLVTRYTRSFVSTLANQNGVSVSTVLKTGNVDYDSTDEIVLVLNEFVGANAIPDFAATRFFVLDDANHDFAEMLADTLVVVTDSGTYHAQVADVAIGDIDNDFIGELVFGGIADLTVAGSCNYDGNGNPGSLRYLLMVQEFTGNGFVKTRTAFSSDDDGQHLYGGSCHEATRSIRFLDVNVLDLDNDNTPEIQANQFVFSGFPEHGWVWSQRADFTLPKIIMFTDDNTTEVFDPGTAVILVNDADGDGRDDLVTYRVGDDRIRIHSVRQQVFPGFPPGPPELFERDFIRVDTQTPDIGVIAGIRINPILFALDADGLNEGDVQTLRFVSHEFVLTEPLVLAAIAAPPCAHDIGQNTDACTSSWGTATVSGTDTERDVSYKAGILAGFEMEFGAGAGVIVDADTKVFGLSAKLALATELAFHQSESYEVTRSVTFETGPMEDSVVFVSTPYDLYNYEVIASTLVNMEDTGADREIQRLGLPRTPVIRMAEAGYYNDHTVDSAFKIGPSVFQHTTGRIDSYPTRFERDAILRTRRDQVEDIRLACPGCWQVDPDAPLISGLRPARQFDPRTALEGLVSEVVGVGQGSGATEVAIDFSRSSSFGNAMEFSAELEVELTIGFVVTGFAVGSGLAHSTTITRGENTAYVGTVGSIGAQHFAEKQYRFGMFTYLQGDPATGQEFEVINYWVE